VITPVPATDRSASRSVKSLRPHQWRPGQSGNPSGRPPCILSRALRAKLKADPSLVERLLEALLRRALGGDLKALEIIFDRIEGRAPAWIGTLSWDSAAEFADQLIAAALAYVPSERQADFLQSLRAAVAANGDE
jgi:hypothetical protein